eukprot:m.40701 g.40701  ORF g.40701 m.40701 type:complete len:61 (+) comp13981_c0_seq1:655-837(+)
MLTIDEGSSSSPVSVAWYLDLPEIPCPRPKLTEAEIAKEGIAKHKLAMAATADANKKKKK